MKGWRLLLLAVIGTGLLPLLLRAEKAPVSPSPQLTIHSVVIDHDAAGRIVEMTVAGSGFDAHTRLLLTPDCGNRRALLKSVPTWGNLQSVTLAGSRLYLANNYRGLQVLDVSDPVRPRQIGTLQLPGTAWKIAVQGNLAAVASKEKGLQIVDVADPGRMQLVGSADLGGNVLDVALAGDLAYVANSRNGLQVVDLSDPAAPLPLATLAIPGKPHSLAVADGIAYLSAAEGGLRIVDVRDPRNPRFLGALKTREAFFSIVVRAGTAYVAAGRAGLLVIDVRLPQNPILLATVDTPGTALGLAVAGDSAYLADNMDGLQVVDIADPGRPRLVGAYGIPGAALAVTVDGERALVAAGRNGLQIVDLRQQAISCEEAVASAGPVIVSGKGRPEYLVIGREVVLVEVRDDGPPLPIANVETAGSARDLQVAGNFLYILSSGGRQQATEYPQTIEVVDVGDPQRPRTVSVLKMPQTANDLLMAKGHLWIGVADGLCRLPLDDPAAPRLAGCLPLPGEVTALARAGDLLLAGDKRGNLYVVDIRLPDTPRLFGSAQMPWHLQAFAASAEIVVDGSLVLVAGGRNGLLLFDIADAERPQLIGGMQLPEGNYTSSVVVSGKTAYVSDLRRGLHLIDVADPTQPHLLATIANQGKARQLLIAGRQIILPTAENLKAFPLPIELKAIAVEGGSTVRAKAPGLIPPGGYTLWAANRGNRAELPGALRVGGPAEN